MIQHTMIVSFNEPVPESELDQFLKEMKTLMVDNGPADRFVSQHAIRVAGDDHAPVFAATAIVQLQFSDLDTLNASFTIAGIEDLIGRWQSKFPYKVVWANHPPLS